MVLQAVVDDSGKGEPPVFVMAGFVLAAEEWAAFSDHWQAALNKIPKIEYFKMKEAFRLSDQFCGFSVRDRDRKLQELVSVILHYDPLRISNVIPHEAYRTAFRGKIAKQMDYPYFLSYYGVMGALFRYKHLLERHAGQKVDFVFDEQGKEGVAPQRVWNFAKESAPAWAKPLIGSGPVHRDDKTFLPLQAADLLAWQTRRFFLEQSRGGVYRAPEWQALSALRCAEDVWDEGRLKKLYQGIRSTGSTFEYDLSPRERKDLKHQQREECHNGKPETQQNG